MIAEKKEKETEMYGPYLPSQMGFRSSGVFRRAGDNLFTYGRKRTSKRKADTKATLDNARRVWYDCPCGKMTRDPQGKCGHYGVTFMGQDNIGKDHL